jgi:putative oxidoreductase
MRSDRLGTDRATASLSFTPREKRMNLYLNLVGRILLALIFVLAGIGKISNAAGTMQYMESMGVPALLFWPTVALEVLGGLAIIVGYQTRLVAFALAAFCVVSALLFHRQLADQTQMIMFLKNLAMAGGFLLLAGTGATAFSIDKGRGA